MSDGAGREMLGLLRDSVAAFLERDSAVARQRTPRYDETPIDRAVWGRMAENGWLGLTIPEADGGLGLGPDALVALVEGLGRGLVPEPFVEAVVLAGGVLRRLPEAEGRAGLLADLVAGARIPVLAWQEAADRYDPLVCETKARRDGQGWSLEGQKRFVAGAPMADVFLVTAALPDGGVGLFACDRTSPGVGARLHRMADEGGSGDVALAGVSVPESGLLADAAVTPKAVEAAIEEARLAVCAYLLGIMEETLDRVLAFTKDRAQFGKPIGSFQALQHRMVDLWVQKQLVRATTDRVVAVFDRTEDAAARARIVSAAKARASEASLLITRQAIQLHGAMGFTDECEIGLFTKRALVLSAWLGNATWHRRRFAGLADGAMAA